MCGKRLLRTTLREIAHHANVHVATASHVLNGSGGSTRVSEETRRRVLEAADRLGYTVNRVAQQLKTQKSRVIGLLVGGLENPFFARMVSLCSEALEQEGYDVVLAVRRRDEANDLHLLQALVSRQFDGILLWSETITEVRERVQQPDMANTVVMGFEIPGRDCVSAELSVGVQAALDHLSAQGRERIGYLAPRISLSREGDLRRDCYARIMAEQGRPERIYAFEGAAFDVAAARERAEQIASEPEMPDALLCFNDMTALGALMGLRRKGLRVPEDVALIGCDDLPLISELDVPLTSIAYPLTELCQTAVQMLLKRIKGKEAREEPLPTRHVLLPTTLHIRKSS